MLCLSADAAVAKRTASSQPRVLEAADDQSGAERVAGANAIDDLHFVTGCAVNLAGSRDDRAPAVQQHPRILAQSDCHRTKIEFLLERARDVCV